MKKIFKKNRSYVFCCCPRQTSALPILSKTLLLALCVSREEKIEFSQIVDAISVADFRGKWPSRQEKSSLLIENFAPCAYGEFSFSFRFFSVYYSLQIYCNHLWDHEKNCLLVHFSVRFSIRLWNEIQPTMIIHNVNCQIISI